MTSPNPADHPLPSSPEPNVSPLPTIPLALPLPAHDDASTSAPPSSPGPVDFTSPPSIESEELVASLQASLDAAQSTISAQTTRLSDLSDVETQLAQLRDQYAFLSAAKEAVENQLHEETKKREVAEENVEMLRGQVEQARRGVMVLQKQEADRKRMSVMSGGGGNGGMTGLGLGGDEEVLNFASMGEPGSRESRLSKRQSIIRPHRRQSSQSEPSDIHIDRPVVSPNPANSGSAGTGSGSGSGNTLRPGAHGHGLRELRLGSTPPTATLPSPNLPLHNSAQSGYFDESPAAVATTPVSVKKLLESPSKKEMEAVGEVQRLRGELSWIQIKLAESEEARMASETCLKALREFMASGSGNGSGDGHETAGPGMEGGLEGEDKDGNMTASTADLLKGIRLPPLPTDREADEDEHDAQRAAAAAAEKAKSTGGGWGFKLWNARAAPTVTSPNRENPPGVNTSPQKSLLPLVENRSRAGSTATVNSKVSPLPTPGAGAGDETASINTVTSTSGGTQVQTSTPLSSFVSNWTKGVASPPTSSVAASVSSPQQVERPGQTRKLSVTSFFSRGAGASAKKESVGAAGNATPSVREESELPTPPETAELESQPGKASLADSDDEREKEKERERRESQATTLTDLEDELGTPRSAAREELDGGEDKVKRNERAVVGGIAL